MFDDIEREYEKDLQEKRFLAYYIPRAIVVSLVAILLVIIVKFDWLVYLCALVLFLSVVVVFFIKEYRHAHKTVKAVRDSTGLNAKILAYNNADDSRRINKLVVDLAKHRIHTRDDLLLVLDYFQSRLPSNSKPNLLEWIFTAVVTLSSVVLVTYDDSINAINMHRLAAVLVPTIIVALIILTPFIMAKAIATGIAKNRNKAETSLVQDLAYIYVNFEKYQTKLLRCS